MTEFGAPAWIDGVADALERAIAAGTGLPRERVFPYFGRPEDLLKFPPAGSFVAVGGPALPVDAGILTGGGAEHCVFDGRFPVHVFARLATDREFRDAKYLRDGSHGIGGLVRKAAKAVLMLSAEQDGRSPFVEPARFARIDFSPRSAPLGWGWATIDVEVKFRTDFTL